MFVLFSGALWERMRQDDSHKIGMQYGGMPGSGSSCDLQAAGAHGLSLSCPEAPRLKLKLVRWRSQKAKKGK
jgi:hypothetical protein